MIVVLARHPATVLPAGICYGRLDVAVAENAVPALTGAIRTHRIGLVWSSPARRCLEPAQATGLRIMVDARLRELDFGAWEGRPWAHIPRSELDAWAADPEINAPPAGETGRSLLARVTAVWNDLAGLGEDCAVIAHGGPLKVLLASAIGRVPDLKTPAVPFGSVEVIRL